MAVASSATRKYKLQESLPDKLHRDVNTIAALLPDKKEWIAEHGLQMLMLNGYENIILRFHTCAVPDDPS